MTDWQVIFATFMTWYYKMVQKRKTSKSLGELNSNVPRRNGISKKTKEQPTIFWVRAYYLQSMSLQSFNAKIWTIWILDVWGSRLPTCLNFNDLKECKQPFPYPNNILNLGNPLIFSVVSPLSKQRVNQSFS